MSKAAPVVPLTVNVTGTPAIPTAEASLTVAVTVTPVPVSAPSPCAMSVYVATASCTPVDVVCAEVVRTVDTPSAPNVTVEESVAVDVNVIVSVTEVVEVDASVYVSVA